MPLAEFIEETMAVLGTDAEEVLVERVKMLRNNLGGRLKGRLSRSSTTCAAH